jgi:hypothetical protein
MDIKKVLTTLFILGLAIWVICVIGLMSTGCASLSQQTTMGDMEYKTRGFAMGKANVAALKSTMEMLREAHNGYDEMITLNQQADGIQSELTGFEIAEILAKIAAIGAL